MFMEGDLLMENGIFIITTSLHAYKGNLSALPAVGNKLAFPQTITLMAAGM